MSCASCCFSDGHALSFSCFCDSVQRIGGPPPRHAQSCVSVCVRAAVRIGVARRPDWYSFGPHLRVLAWQCFGKSQRCVGWTAPWLSSRQCGSAEAQAVGRPFLPTILRCCLICPPALSLCGRPESGRASRFRPKSARRRRSLEIRAGSAAFGPTPAGFGPALANLGVADQAWRPLGQVRRQNAALQQQDRVNVRSSTAIASKRTCSGWVDQIAVPAHVAASQVLEGLVTARGTPWTDNPKGEELRALLLLHLLRCPGNCRAAVASPDASLPVASLLSDWVASVTRGQNRWIPTQERAMGLVESGRQEASCKASRAAHPSRGGPAA